jgi:hypothetical protein
MFWELVSQLQLSQAIKASTNRFGATLTGASAPSSEYKPRHKRNRSTAKQEGQGIIVFARAAQQSPIVTITTRVVQRGELNDSRGLEGRVS